MPDRFTTQLSPAEELQFQHWKAKYAPRDSGADYDLRGAFKAGLRPDAKTAHWSDQFKKPNHPTFSNESQYAAYGNPGYWAQDAFPGLGSPYVPGPNPIPIPAVREQPDDPGVFPQLLRALQSSGLVAGPESDDATRRQAERLQTQRDLSFRAGVPYSPDRLLVEGDASMPRETRPMSEQYPGQIRSGRVNLSVGPSGFIDPQTYGGRRIPGVMY